MKLIDFLKNCKKLIEENPAALGMEMIGVQSASGAPDEVSSINFDQISTWDESEFPIKEYLPRDYTMEQFLNITLG